VSPLDALNRQVHDFPDSVAFCFSGNSWSYRRLAAEADRQAQAMLARGLEPGDRVALHMTNRPELIAAYYACLRIGAIASPLNIRLKTAELRPLLKRLQSKLFLGEALLYPQVVNIEAEVLPAGARFVIEHDAMDRSAQRWEAFFQGATTKVSARPPGSGRPAVLLTTSGTTGEPKFVTHTPETISAGISSWDCYGMDRTQIAIMPLPMVHGAGLYTFLAGIRFGMPMVLLERFDPAIVLDSISQRRCSWMLGMPFMFADMIVHQQARPRDVSALRFCCSAGDVCPPGLQENFHEVFGLPLHSLWGATEVGAFLPGLETGPVTRVPPNLEAKLVDDQGVPVARGETGELLVRGPGVTPGYWEASGRIDDPKGKDGWFATGDLMRQGKDDQLWFVGRKKDLIIRGGSNISPVEVERVLCTHPAVRDAAVVGVPDAVLGQCVVALVQLVSGAGKNEPADIVAMARTYLADYKVPERLIIVGSIPRNTFGKIDREALRRNSLTPSRLEGGLGA
jgi:long-chain acyl-CoA synthetase